MMTTATRTVRPIYCVIDHLYQDLDRARDVCAGRFEVGGVTLTTGDAPNWCDVAVDPDRERWIEWSKFYYGLDLASAFARTGDAVFLHTWERLVRSWLAQVPIGFGPTDALGRRLQNWIYAWNRFADVTAFAGFSAGFEELLTARIAQEADYLQANLTGERNHRTLELYALMVVALALPSNHQQDARLRFAWRELQQNFVDDFRPDGVHREHSTHYHMIVLRSFLGARENARRAGLEIPDAYDDALRRAFAFAMYCHRPDGSMPALSDSDVGSYRDLLQTAGEILGQPSLLYVATNGGRGIPPPRRCADFIEAGYFVQCSAFDRLSHEPDAHRSLIFDCGPVGDGGHGHYDALSIDVWCGRHLLIDPGRYSYDASSRWRQWFKGTAAHNTVCIDGLDQTGYRPGKPRRPARTRLLTRYSSTLLDAVGGEVVSSEYDALHRRHVFFIAGEYWIVLDELEAVEPHDYDLRFHLASDASEAIDFAADQLTVPGLRLLFDGPGEVAIEDGWMSPQYGLKLPAPVVSKRAAQHCSARFITVIVPLDASNSSTRFTLAASPAADVIGTVVVGVRGPHDEHVDRLRWRTGESGSCHAALERRNR